MFSGFNKDLVPITVPGFMSARAYSDGSGPANSVRDFSTECLMQIGGWSDWENYGLFVMQNPFSRIGEALVAMTTLRKGTDFKTIEEVVVQEGFRHESIQKLPKALKITNENDSFFGGYEMPITTARGVAEKVNQVYCDRIGLNVRETSQHSQAVVAITFSPKKNYQVAKYWAGQFPLKFESGIFLRGS